VISLLLPPPLTGALAFLLLVISPVLGFTCLMPFALAKLMFPVGRFRLLCSQLSVVGAQVWLQFNRLVYRMFYPTAWDISLPEGLDPHKSYLLICNHQSWIDVLVLADAFYGRVPFPRFFLKHELLYVPVIGLGCWAMEMPFMKRHSKEALKANPALKREDLETTRRFCERYRQFPVSVVNFVEGTRFNERKRAAFNSPYRHLLRPKSAGLRIALDAMGEQFAGIIDVTIAYRPSPHPVVWSFLRGEQNELALHAEFVSVPKDLMTGDYEDDPDFRARFQTWLNQLWARKDAKLDALLARPAATVTPRAT
jgi:1-acyl-sn-glycerol-3-phosphate acyltransferase